MPVEFIKQLHQASLERAWNARPAKPAKDPMLKRRHNVLSRIDAALAQLKSGETNPPRGDYQSRAKFDGVRVQLKYGSRALTIDGRDHWFVEDAATFFRSAREAVESGQLDAAIVHVLENKAKQKASTMTPESRPLQRENVYTLNRAPAPAQVTSLAPVPAADDQGTASGPSPVQPGKFARKYERLLAAGLISEPGN